MVKGGVALDGQVGSSYMDELSKVRHLLYSQPNEFAPWAAAIGEKTHKNTATTLNRTFDELLPGLYSFPIPDGKAGASSRSVRVMVPNVFSRERVTAEVQKMALHSPKLTNPDADRNAPVPLDLAESFDGSDLLIGAHSLAHGVGLDFYSGAASSSIYKQVRHVMSNDGVYTLPICIEKSDLADEVVAYIALVEEVVASPSLHASREVAAISGLPQIFIPELEGSSRYIAITPLACGAVLSEISDSIKQLTFGQEPDVAAGESRKTVLTASFMPMVANRQNLSGLISKVRRIYFAAPPLIDAGARRAHSMVTRTDRWVQREFQNFIRSKDDATVRTALNSLRCHIEDVLSRSVQEPGGEIRDSTSANERRYEVNAVRFLCRRVIAEWLSLSRDHADCADGSLFAIENFNVAESGCLLLNALVSVVGIAVSPHTKGVWMQAIHCEIHEQLGKLREELSCG